MADDTLECVWLDTAFFLFLGQTTELEKKEIGVEPHALQRTVAKVDIYAD